MRQSSAPRAARGFACVLIAASAACHSPTSSNGGGGGGGALTSLAGRLAFVRSDLYTRGSWQVKPDGTGAGAVVEAPAFGTPLATAVSPDGHRLAVEMQQGNDVSRISVHDLRSGGSTPFPADQTRGYGAPSWSPSGAEIAFEDGRSMFSVLSGAIEYGRVYVANADGSGARVVGDSAVLGSALTWSHDGTQVLYSRAFVLVSVKGDGSTVTPVPIGSAAAVLDPAMSPDGTRIALSALAPDSTLMLFVMNADGSSPTMLAGGLQDDRHPAWSPDGTLLAIQRMPRTSVDSLAVIVVMSATGANAHVVSPAGSLVLDTWPSWGPATP